MIRPRGPRVSTRAWSLARALAWVVVAVAIALPGLSRYGLTWDEPTYFRFAQLQRAWLGDVVSQPGEWRELFARTTIDRVWLQHAERNGHPPLHEVWQAIGGLPFRAVGFADPIAFRAANALLLALTVGGLFLLVAPRLGKLCGAVAALVYLGVPAIWAHGHLGATETLQNLAWVACALALPRVLRGDEGGAEGGGERGGERWRWRGLAIWGLIVALAFCSKFTNLLAPAWALGAAALAGEWRRPRFWVVGAVTAVAAPLGLLLFDPYFWPWLDGWPLFLDYFRQTTTRGDWMPINVFYLGKSWGFHPPWHYRPVELLAALSWPVLFFFAVGVIAVIEHVSKTCSDVWTPMSAAARAAAPTADEGWIPRLALSGLALTFVVGWLPSTPNHDGTRQFVYVFLAVALAAAWGVHRVREQVSRVSKLSGLSPRPSLRSHMVGMGALLLAGFAFGVSLAREPNGLAYRGPVVGGVRGAAERGLELSYWGDAVNGKLLAAIAAHGGADAGEAAGADLPSVYTIPKLDFCRDSENFWQPLVPLALRTRDRLGIDAIPAYWDAAITDADRRRLGPELRMSFRERPDFLVIFFRRSTVTTDFIEFLDDLVARGDLVVVAENLEEGVPLARVYRFEKMEQRLLDTEQPGRFWQPASVGTQR